MAGSKKHPGLLAAFLEATEKIDLRAMRRREAAGEMPAPVSIEAQLECAIAAAPEVEAPKSPILPFALRRANLVAGS